MSDAALTESSPATGGRSRPRRALLLAGSPAAAALAEQLTAAGYEILCAAPGDAAQAIREFMPEVALIAPDGGDVSETDTIALARRLRAQPETYGLPLIFLYQRDERGLRSAALQIGADDYFAFSTPPSEMCARLDALFWRAEAGRRSAPVVAEQRSEIDNFLLLLDAVRADAEGGATGTLALVGDVLSGGMDLHAADTGRLLVEVHGFFKLQLRRVDGVSFYGPSILLVYMPRRAAIEARATLAHLRGQFLETHTSNDLAIGLASFPADSCDVERLIEHAEMSLHRARVADASSRIVAAGGEEEKGDGPAAPSVSPPPAVVAEDAAQALGTGLDSRVPETRARPVREKKAHDETDAAAPLSSQVDARAGAAGGGGDAGRSALAGAALEAGMRERERRASGAVMPRRLLLAVSDAARMAQLNLLLRSAGYEVRAAFDGQQALSLLRIERPDLLLVDFELHDMDGAEMLRRLGKQSGGRVKLPVVLLLPAQRVSVRAAALEAGAGEVIMMPCDPSELLDSIRTAGTAAG